MGLDLCFVGKDILTSINIEENENTVCRNSFLIRNQTCPSLYPGFICRQMRVRLKGLSWTNELQFGWAHYNLTG